MRSVLIFGVLVGIALVTWLLAGRWLVTLLDRVTVVVVDHPRVERLAYEDGALEVGGKHLDLTNASFAKVAEVSIGSGGRVSLESGGQQFPLGQGRADNNGGGVPRFEFTKDDGDEVLFTVQQSRLPWNTPFEMNFMTGYSPSRKRNVYLKLRWTKSRGDKLEMLWKTGQSYYSRDGWLPRSIESVTNSLNYVKIQGSR